MTIVVGLGPVIGSGSGLELAGRLARSTGDDLVICCVVHDAWDSPSMRDFVGVDDDWRRELREGAKETLAEAVERVGPGVSVTTTVKTGRSVPRALAEEGESLDARLLVIGSSTNAPFGHISFGSAGDSLVHSASTAVAVAPRGYRESQLPIGRLVVAVYPTERDVLLSEPVVALAKWMSASVEVVTFASRDPAAMAQFAGGKDVFDYWRTGVDQTHQRIGEQLGKADVQVSSPSLVQGVGWANTVEAFPWRPDDLLVIGSSEYGPIARVFLGSSAYRIVRHAPVPVILLPRH